MSLNSLTQIAQENFETLTQNTYPGRGIVIGKTPNGEKMVQVYWIMGRSENSRNRVFIQEPNGFVRTQAFDPSKLTDPSLIIYFPVKVVDQKHIVTNGDQTDTLEASFLKGQSHEESLSAREYEPDPDNFTPRISGVVELGGKNAYELSILKSFHNSEASSLRFFYKYEKAISGLAHGITTYLGDGNPLPSFSGEPRLLPVFDDAQETLEKYWNALNSDNRVSLLVKTIDLKSGQSQILIKNTHS